MIEGREQRRRPRPNHHRTDPPTPQGGRHDRVTLSVTSHLDLGLARAREKNLAQKICYMTTSVIALIIIPYWRLGEMDDKHVAGLGRKPHTYPETDSVVHRQHYL